MVDSTKSVRDETGSDDLFCNVYGTIDRFVLLFFPLGAIPPPYVGDLPRLGDPADLFARAVWFNRSRQADVAAAIGVSQQSVSRYLSGQSRPQLPAESWQTLVRMAIETRVDAG